MELGKLSDLFGCDLAGWQIAQVHFLQLDHGLMGIFPAITVEEEKEGEIIIVADKSSLRKVWDRIKRQSAIVTSFMAIVNATEGIAFNMEGSDRATNKPIFIMTDEEIDILCQKKNPFQWEPGLISFSDNPVRDPLFV